MAKRENEALQIKELMNLFINQNKLEKGIQQLRVEELWPNLMGHSIAKYTTSVKLIGDTLFVKLTSSVLREELSYGKEKIIKMMNDELNTDVIKKIILQ